MPESTAYFRDLLNELNDLGINEQHRLDRGFVHLAGVVNGKLLKIKLVTPTMLIPGETRQWDAATKASLKQQQQAQVIEQLQCAGLHDSGGTSDAASVFTALRAWADCPEQND